MFQRTYLRRVAPCRRHVGNNRESLIPSFPLRFLARGSGTAGTKWQIQGRKQDVRTTTVKKSGSAHDGGQGREAACLLLTDVCFNSSR